MRAAQATTSTPHYNSTVLQFSAGCTPARRRPPRGAIDSYPVTNFYHWHLVCKGFDLEHRRLKAHFREQGPA